ncbi:MAG: IPT/TIG domain-containing protein [Bacteroidales bacterium]
MKKHTQRSMLMLLLSFMFCISCNDKDTKPELYDPSAPVQVTGFYPQTGGARTQFFIYGENFGTDLSLIQVTIGDKNAKVIGSNGSCIYCLVPSRAGSDCKVSVKVGKEEQSQQCSFEETFGYEAKPIVTTLCGYTDKDGNTAIVDGDFDKAQFEEPYWMAFDKYKNIFLIEEGRALRKLSVTERKVNTLFRTGNGIGRIRTLAFTASEDSLILGNDQGDNYGVGILYCTKDNGYNSWETMISCAFVNGASVHPITGDMYYNDYRTGMVIKYDFHTNKAKDLFRINDVNEEFNIQFAPSGEFAYIVVKNHHVIYKVKYNYLTRELEKPSGIFCGVRRGDENDRQFADGVGTSAMFSQPHQGAFDEHDNFYLCDVMNHIIRKITPEGVVTTFAGRPQEWGYADGELRKAMFDRPHGIAYDKSTGTFYVADQKNRRIRAISTE